MKRQIRESMLKKRGELSPVEQRESADKLVGHVIAWFEACSLPARATIGGYYPVRGEIDDLSLLTVFGENGYGVALPCVDEGTKYLIFREWAHEKELIQGKYNIPEPDQNAPITIPNMLLVPMVAAGRDYSRLGYGGGYYDTTIQHLRNKNPELVVIGLAYDFQLLDSLPVEAHDAKMNVIFTPSGRV